MCLLLQTQCAIEFDVIEAHDTWDISMAQTYIS